MIRQPRAVKRRMLVPVERLSLADNYCVGRQAQIGMKLRAFTALNAMRRRWSACVMKARVAERMPVARGDDSNVSRDRFLNQRIDQWDDLIAVGDRQRAARAEVALQVYDDERIARLEPHRIAGHCNNPTFPRWPPAMRKNMTQFGVSDKAHGTQNQ